MLSPRRIIADLRLYGRSYLRHRLGFFFALILPVILILIFGAVYSGGSNSSVVVVYAQNQDGPSQVSASFLGALNGTGTLRVSVVDSSENLTQYLASHSASFGIVIPPGFALGFSDGTGANVTVIVESGNSSSSSSSSVFTGAVAEVTNAFNAQRAGAPQVLRTHFVYGAGQREIKPIDYLIPGLVGVSVLASSMFTMVSVSAYYRQDKMFKQLALTPLTKEEWLASKVIWYALQAVLAFVLMTAAGILIFGAQLSISLWVVPFLLMGPLMFVALGMLVGTVTRTAETASVLGNIIMFPMLFLSGTFFPLSSMPQYLQTFARVLPLFYVIDGLNEVMVFGDYNQALVDMLVLVLLSAIIVALSIRLSVWTAEDK